jgi:hypothetical protein
LLLGLVMNGVDDPRVVAGRVQDWQGAHRACVIEIVGNMRLRARGDAVGKQRRTWPCLMTPWWL